MTTATRKGRHGRRRFAGMKRWGIAVAFTATLCLCPLLWLGALLAGEQSPLACIGLLGWLSIGVITTLIGYTWTLRRGLAMDLCEPLYFVSLLFLILFVIRPLYILFQPSARPALMPTDPALLDRALLLGALGFIGFYAGYEARLGARLGAKFAGFGLVWSQRRLLSVAVLFIVLGVTGFAVGVAGSGGPRAFLGNLQGRHLLRDSGQWAFASLRVLVTVSTALLWANYLTRRRFLGLAVMGLLLTLGMTLPLGGRAAVLVPILTLLVMWYSLQWQRPRHLAVVALVVVALALAGGTFVVVFKALRDYTQAGGDLRDLLASSSTAAGQSTSPLPSLATIGPQFMAEFAQFDWLVTLLGLVPQTMPFQHGRSFLDFFAMFVPRLLWPAKPTPIAYVANAAAGGSGASGTPFTILGELYLNFGVAGSFLGMVFFGVVAKAMYAFLEHHRRDPGVVLIYAYLVASLHNLFTRSFAPKAFGLVLFVVPAVIAIWLIRRKQRPLRA